MHRQQSINAQLMSYFKSRFHRTNIASHRFSVPTQGRTKSSKRELSSIDRQIFNLWTCGRFAIQKRYSEGEVSKWCLFVITENYRLFSQYLLVSIERASYRRACTRQLHARRYDARSPPKARQKSPAPHRLTTAGRRTIETIILCFIEHLRTAGQQ